MERLGGEGLVPVSLAPRWGQRSYVALLRGGLTGTFHSQTSGGFPDLRRGESEAHSYAHAQFTAPSSAVQCTYFGFENGGGVTWSSANAIR